MVRFPTASGGYRCGSGPGQDSMGASRPCRNGWAGRRVRGRAVVFVAVWPNRACRRIVKIPTAIEVGVWLPAMAGATHHHPTRSHHVRSHHTLGGWRLVWQTNYTDSVSLDSGALSRLLIRNTVAAATPTNPAITQLKGESRADRTNTVMVKKVVKNNPAETTCAPVTADITLQTWPGYFRFCAGCQHIHKRLGYLDHLSFGPFTTPLLDNPARQVHIRNGGRAGYDRKRVRGNQGDFR